MSTNELTRQIKEEIEELSRKRNLPRHTLLMNSLHRIQEEYGYIPDFAMQELSEITGIAPAEVNAYVSFYHFFSTEPTGRHKVWFCRTISCHLAGKDQIVKAVQDRFGVKMGQTTPDGRFTFAFTNCMGMCDKGPAMLIDGETYTKLTPEKVLEILEKYE